MEILKHGYINEYKVIEDAFSWGEMKFGLIISHLKLLRQ
jgi:hypothetical protein